jgi:hypothetical protein
MIIFLTGKKIKSEQVALNSKALLHDLEVSALMPRTDASLLVTDSRPVPKPGETVSVYLMLQVQKFTSMRRGGSILAREWPDLGLVSTLPSRVFRVLLLMCSSQHPRQLLPQ